MLHVADTKPRTIQTSDHPTNTTRRASCHFVWFLRTWSGFIGPV